MLLWRAALLYLGLTYFGHLKKIKAYTKQFKLEKIKWHNIHNNGRIL